MANMEWCEEWRDSGAGARAELGVVGTPYRELLLNLKASAMLQLTLVVDSFDRVR